MHHDIYKHIIRLASPQLLHSVGGSQTWPENDQSERCKVRPALGGAPKKTQESTSVLYPFFIRQLETAGFLGVIFRLRVGLKRIATR